MPDATGLIAEARHLIDTTNPDAFPPRIAAGLLKLVEAVEVLNSRQMTGLAELKPGARVLLTLAGEMPPEACAEFAAQLQARYPEGIEFTVASGISGLTVQQEPWVYPWRDTHEG